MILKYVLKNFSRRKVRTTLMILSLLVSTGLIVTMSATVESIRQSTANLVAIDASYADIVISKRDTSLDLNMPVDETAALIRAADERVTGVYPRIQMPVKIELPNKQEETHLVGLDSANDKVGSVQVIEGEYVLGDGQVAVYKDQAEWLGISVGDRFDVTYAVPSPREPGEQSLSGTSQRRIRRTFTVSSIVVQDGVTGGQGGLLAELSDLQAWLNLPGQANQIMVTVDPALYETNNTDLAALRVRSVARSVQQQLGGGTRLGDEYRLSMEKAVILSMVAQVFLGLQALINTYGLISLGVVGLLVYTLVMTNVQEQRRDMAILRILGSQRNVLFGLVIVEVLVVGAIGVSLGVLFGQALTSYVVVPLLDHFFTQEGVTLRLVPQVTLTALLPPVIYALIVLILSSLKPAREAARTKVMHALNPGVADNIQLEDLAQLRERRPDLKMFFGGLALLLAFAMITGLDMAEEFGLFGLEAAFFLLGILALVAGLSLTFFITTIPFERLALLILGLVFPRVTYFARRNVGRGRTLNTLISLLVLFSAVLPSFLGTQVQLGLANSENRTRMRFGADVKLRPYAHWETDGDPIATPPDYHLLSPGYVRDELATLPGIGQMVGVSYPYASRASDSVGMRSASVAVLGVDGDLTQVFFEDMITFTAGGPEALQALLSDHDAVIISEGLAEYLAVELGEVIDLQAAGLDNVDKARVVGIVRRLPGEFSGITRSRIAAQSQSTVFVSMPHFRRLITELNVAPPHPGDPLLRTVFATLEPGVTPEHIRAQVGQEWRAETETYRWYFIAWALEEYRGDTVFFTIFLLALTGISFTTAVFSVFAVIFVSIYARRIEIGMLKAIGMLRREINGMLVVEAIAMTLGSALAGIAAGASMGYLNFAIDTILRQTPFNFAVDPIVMPAIIVMVVLSSTLGATLSARRIVRKQAVEILRMS